MQVRLVVVAGTTNTSSVELHKFPTIIGRSREAGLTVAHPLISRRHCEISENDGLLMIRDLGSLNGTHLGGARIREAAISPNAEFTVGPLTFRAEYDYDGDLTELPPVVPYVASEPDVTTEFPVAFGPAALASELPTETEPDFGADESTEESTDEPAPFGFLDSPNEESADEDSANEDPTAEDSSDNDTDSDEPAWAAMAMAAVADSPSGEEAATDDLADAASDDESEPVESSMMPESEAALPELGIAVDETIPLEEPVQDESEEVDELAALAEQTPAIEEATAEVAEEEAVEEFDFGQLTQTPAADESSDREEIAESAETSEFELAEEDSPIVEAAAAVDAPVEQPIFEQSAEEIAEEPSEALADLAEVDDETVEDAIEDVDVTEDAVDVEIEIPQIEIPEINTPEVADEEPAINPFAIEEAAEVEESPAEEEEEADEAETPGAFNFNFEAADQGTAAPSFEASDNEVPLFDVSSASASPEIAKEPSPAATPASGKKKRSLWPFGKKKQAKSTPSTTAKMADEMALPFAAAEPAEEEAEAMVEEAVEELVDEELAEEVSPAEAIAPQAIDDNEIPDFLKPAAAEDSAEEDEVEESADDDASEEADDDGLQDFLKGLQ